jgi:hypothetical protein
VTPYVGIAGVTHPELLLVKVLPVRIDDVSADELRWLTTVRAK